MKLDEFLRLFPLRAPNIMWFLGAGASAAAGIPTAWDMLWEFKRSLYCTNNRVSPKTCEDLGDQLVRNRLQRWFDAHGGYPPADDPDEYAFYFEAAYPAEQDRRAYIESAIKKGKPSFGNHVIASLLKSSQTRILWSTNFDTLVEDAAARAFGNTSSLVVATLDRPSLGTRALNESRTPLYVKLHGDFRSERLKNTPEELKTQDSEFRRSLIDACCRSGLAVIGFSGRDQSIMDTLGAAIDQGRGYPNGLFWFHRGDGEPYSRVTELIGAARAAGVQAEIVEIQTFDEFFGDIVRTMPTPPTEMLAALSEQRQSRLSFAPIPNRGHGWPVVRLNALPVTSYPATCRLVDCEVGGTKDVRAAIAAAGVDLIAARQRVGVLAFGRDADVRKAFDAHTIRLFDLHSIEARRLKYESAEKGLLYESLGRALTRKRPLQLVRKGPHLSLMVDPARANDRTLDGLRRTTKSLTGRLTAFGCTWFEKLNVRLDYRFNHLWLLLQPSVGTTFETEQPTEAQKNGAKDFVRERLAGRYNQSWNALLDNWIEILLGPGAEAEFRAFHLSDGVDATFRISRTTSFSRRGG